MVMNKSLVLYEGRFSLEHLGQAYGDVSWGESSMAAGCVISGPDRTEAIVTRLKWDSLKQIERRVPADPCRPYTPLRQNWNVSL